MTDTSAVSRKREGARRPLADEQLAISCWAALRKQSAWLLRPDGLLSQVTKTVPEQDNHSQMAGRSRGRLERPLRAIPGWLVRSPAGGR